MAKHAKIENHRDACTRPAPTSRESWFACKSPLGYTGLYVRVNKSGNRSFYYRYSMNGAQRKIFIASVTDMNIKEAYAEHGTLARQVKQGNDIAALKQIAVKEQQAKAAQPKAITMTSLVNKWLDQYLDKNVTSYTYQVVSKRVYKHIIPALGQMAAEDIAPRYVIELRDKILATGKGPTSNAVLGHLKQIFQWGSEELLIDNHNPAREIRRRAKVKPRETAYNDSQIQHLWLAMESDKIPEPHRLALRVLLLTGARRREITDLRFSEVTIDGDVGAISLPPERVKTRVAHQIFLPPQTTELIQRAMNISTSTNFIFGNPLKHRQGKPIARDTLTKMCRNLLDGLGYDGCLHSLRHTFATTAIRLDVDYQIVEQMLNHSLRGTGAVYVKSKSLRKMKTAWSVVADHVQTIVEGAEVVTDSNVLQMFNRKAS